MRKPTIILIAMMVMATLAGIASNRKLSPWLRQLSRGAQRQQGMRRAAAIDSLTTIAFIRIADKADSILTAHGSHSLARFGDIHIACMPISELDTLSRLDAVLRIEARQPNALLMDSTALHIHAQPVYTGRALPHPFTGRGVVVGVQDVGFDLTHPNFFTPDLSDYRIKALWDMLANNTTGSRMPVGADFTGREALLAYAHSRDGIDQTHGTNTAGMAAGSGYNTPYCGMAFESDICLVANAVTEDIALIDSTDYYMYTSATDALGFKYIFDYAEQQGKPCVINFSEGSHEGFDVQDELLYAVLDSLSGPGRIIMAAAGNKGQTMMYFHKWADEEAAGAFVTSGKELLLQFKAADAFDIRCVVRGEQADTMVIASDLTFGQIDSLYSDTLRTADGLYALTTVAYPSCFNARDTVVELLIEAPHTLSNNGVTFSTEAVGIGADVDCYISGGQFANDSKPGSHLTAAEASHSIHSPGAAPAVVCVGATSYRQGFYNWNGQWRNNKESNEGMRLTFTSVGPTVDGRVKPDIMAPGNNIISSYSSFYFENHPDASDNRKSTVSTTELGDRSFPWTANSGTSMACPVAAGAVALWLEARPDLTPADVMDAFRHTCRQPDASLPYPNNLYGYGEINVYHGLLYILGIDGIEGISSSPTTALRLLSSPSGTLTLQATAPTQHSLRLRLYAIDGTLLQTYPVSAAALTQPVTLTLPSKAKGLLLLQADTQDPALRGSMLVRTN